jgi:HEAT repeat protein
MDILVQRVLTKDPSATLLAKQLGKSATPSLIPLATNVDPVVREIALRCLDQSGGPGIAEVFVHALLDDSGSVRAAALTGLQSNLDGSIYGPLLSAFDKSMDAITRQQIALLIGRLHGARLRDLQQRCSAEKEAEAQEGCVTALARMGDNSAQADFVRRLHSAKDRELKRYLDHVSYIHQIWAARALGPILENKSPILRIGVDGLPGPEYLRACDVAVNLLVEIGGITLSFLINGHTNYTDSQLGEARRALRKLP